MKKFGIRFFCPADIKGFFLPAREYCNCDAAAKALKETADNMLVHVVAFKEDTFTLHKVSDIEFIIYNKNGDMHCGVKVDSLENE